MKSVREKVGLDILGGTIALLGIAAIMLAAGWVSPARAADKGKPSLLDELPGATPKSPFNGCGIKLYGSVLNGDVDLGGPINIGSNGQEAGAGVLCDVAMGAFVVGAGIDYGRVFGDLETIGVDAAMSVYARAGVIVTPSTMAYALVAFSRLDTAGGDLDGWQFGGGLETRLQTAAPLFLSLEYRHGTYDLADIGGPAIDAEIQTVRAGLTYKLN